MGSGIPFDAGAVAGVPTQYQHNPVVMPTLAVCITYQKIGCMHRHCNINAGLGALAHMCPKA